MWNFSSISQSWIFTFTLLNKLNPDNKLLNFSPWIDIFSELRNDRKLITNKWKIHIDNNYTYTIVTKAIESRPAFYIHRTTRFQARYIEAALSILETTLNTHLEN